MELFWIIFWLVLGLVFIIKGGDWFVDAATWMAEVSGIPKFIIGATVVSLATTMPELLTSAFGTAKGSVDIAIGNAVGSVTANLGLILAISFIAMPHAIKPKDYIVKTVLMLGAAAVIVVGGLTGSMGIVPTLILAILCVVNVVDNLKSAKSGTKEKKIKKKIEKKELWINIAKFVVGVVGIVWGADLLVDNGSELARFMGISERVIGVTLIAVGTSLPELVTTVTAIVKKQKDLSVGNILGANIIDLTLILPVCAVVSGVQGTGFGLEVSSTIASIDLPAALVIGAVATIPSLFTKKFARWQGVALLALYVVYLAISISL